MDQPTRKAMKVVCDAATVAGKRRMSETGPEKPAMGKLCNGCGVCCAAELCQLAKEIFPLASAPCPALEFENGRFWCGVARSASKYTGTPATMDGEIGETVLSLLGAGCGCCSNAPEGYAVESVIAADCRRLTAGPSSGYGPEGEFAAGGG
jgi:hypothetical protein